MKKKVYLIIIASYLVSSLAAAPLSAQSEGGQDQLWPAESDGQNDGEFFKSGSQITPFAPRMEEGDRARFEYAPRKGDEFAVEEDELAPLTPEQREEQQLAKLTPRERILKKFGDPSSRTPVLATNDAPTPFKGMMEALEAGEEQLAFQYAKQHARNLQDIKKRQQRVMSMTALAMERSGAIEEGAWPYMARFDEDKKLFNEDKEREAKARAGLVDELNGVEASAAATAAPSAINPATKSSAALDARSKIMLDMASREVNDETRLSRGF